jgi:hypothetical protein
MGQFRVAKSQGSCLVGQQVQLTLTILSKAKDRESQTILAARSMEFLNLMVKQEKEVTCYRRSNLAGIIPEDVVTSKSSNLFAAIDESADYRHACLR